ncbi:insulinase family protein [Mesorhizobium sp. M0965]|uniref:insulinase family protein n=1 Tax=unclassified Mesorhizobium TaxID=325217 RepID=UPI00333A9B70
MREKRGLAYGIHSSLKDHQHSNALVVTTATRADRAAETLGLIRHVIRELAETGPTEAELKASKKYLIGTYATNNLDSSSSIAATLVGSWHRLHQCRAALIDRPSRGSGEEAAFGRTRHYGGRPGRGRQRMGPGSNFAILLPL